MHPDHREYIGVTRPARIEKALVTLEGLLAGVGVDGLDPRSRDLLLAWADEHRDVAHSHPFSHILPRLRLAMADGVLDAEEHADLTWMCSAWLPNASRFRPGTNEIQELHGLLGGVAADGHITDAETDLLVQWLDSHDHVSDLWPYQDVARMLTEALRDGVIDERERRELVSFFAEFTRTADHRVISQHVVASRVGPCAVDPDVVFQGRSFVFTGASAHGTRKELEAVIRRLGGGVDAIHADLDYLVVGANGNPTWAYSCYGRKLEDVMNRVAMGRSSTVIVYEPDFWRAVAEHGGEVPEARLGDGVPATTAPVRLPAPAAEESADIPSLLAAFVTEKRAQGWHVEVDPTRCTLHRVFKNGKPRKAAASLLFVSTRVDENGVEVPMTDRSRPWLVRASRSPRTFKDLRKAVDVFVVESAELSLEA